MQLLLDREGLCLHPRILLMRRAAIERGAMASVSGIVVHQTGAATAQSTLSAYTRPNANGAHFLIDRDGTLYQTASLRQMTWHVGPLKARCLVERRCTPGEQAQLRRFNPAAEHRREIVKPAPLRYPANADSIGIEMVGDALPHDVPDDKRVYEIATPAQNEALHWLVTELAQLLTIPMHEIYRHPQVSRKNPTEASSARW